MLGIEVMEVKVWLFLVGGILFVGAVVFFCMGVWRLGKGFRGLKRLEITRLRELREKMLGSQRGTLDEAKEKLAEAKEKLSEADDVEAETKNVFAEVKGMAGKEKLSDSERKHVENLLRYVESAVSYRGSIGRYVDSVTESAEAMIKYSELEGEMTREIDGDIERLSKAVGRKGGREEIEDIRVTKEITLAAAFFGIGGILMGFSALVITVAVSY